MTAERLSTAVHDQDGHTEACFAHHMGPWLIKPETMRGLVEEYRAGRIRAVDPRPASGTTAVVEPGPGETEALLYTKDDTGVALIPVTGVMVKGESKFGGTTNTQRTRRAVRAAAADPDVETIVLLIDSPGGMAAGTPELAADIRKTNQKKPVFAHIDDDAGSAAYYIASQAGTISAQETSWAGSIGTLIVLYDQAEQYQKDGIKTYVVSTGPFKGAFSPGAEIPPEHIAYAQQIVDSHAEFFIQAVAEGRKAAGMTMKGVRAAADGRMYPARTAMAMGMIDKVQRADATIADARARATAIREGRAQSGTPKLDRARRRERASSAEL